MFGFSGGEIAETVKRKRAYMAEARERWPFLTLFDDSTTRSEIQLIRWFEGVTRSEAELDVQSWTRDCQF